MASNETLRDNLRLRRERKKERESEGTGLVERVDEKSKHQKRGSEPVCECLNKNFSFISHEELCLKFRVGIIKFVVTFCGSLQEGTVFLFFFFFFLFLFFFHGMWSNGIWLSSRTLYLHMF